VYKKEKYSKTTLDGATETIETEERNSSGLLEFCAAIIAITLSILTATLILHFLNHDNNNRRLDRTLTQSQKTM
jgi:hypothetical protein